MFIGELAKRCSVSTKALRHYESLGLLGPVRRQGKYRVYDQATLHRVQFIKTVQNLGYRLTEIQTALQQQAGGEPSWQAILDLIEQKQTALNQQMATLAQQNQALAEHRRTIERCLQQDPHCKKPLYPA